MKEELPEKDKRSSTLKIMGLAMGIPTTIIGMFFFFYLLDQKEILDLKYGIVLTIAAVANTFYIMIRYASKKN